MNFWQFDPPEDSVPRSGSGESYQDTRMLHVGPLWTKHAMELFEVEKVKSRSSTDTTLQYRFFSIFGHKDWVTFKNCDRVAWKYLQDGVSVLLRRLKGRQSKTTPRVDLEQGWGRNDGTHKSELLAREDLAGEGRPEKSWRHEQNFQINSGWVLTNPIALQIGWIRERRPE